MQQDVTSDIEFLTAEQYQNLPELQRNKYTPMTQAQLAKTSGIHVMAVTQIANLRQNSINIYHISAIAKTLGISDISRIRE